MIFSTLKQPPSLWPWHTQPAEKWLCLKEKCILKWNVDSCGLSWFWKQWSVFYRFVLCNVKLYCQTAPTAFKEVQDEVENAIPVLHWFIIFVYIMSFFYLIMVNTLDYCLVSFSVTLIFGSHLLIFWESVSVNWFVEIRIINLLFCWQENHFYDGLWETVICIFLYFLIFYKNYTVHQLNRDKCASNCWL